MKKIILNHSYTPPSLEKINQDLDAFLGAEDPDEAIFLKLVTERDEFIQNFLKNIEGEEKTNFVEAELEVNGALVAYTEKLFKASLKQLSGLVRGRKAVKKYI